MSLRKAVWCSLLLLVLAAASVAEGARVDNFPASGQVGEFTAGTYPFQDMPKLTTSYHWISDWVEVDHLIATRDGLGRVTDILYETVADGQWQSASHRILTYSANDGPDTVTDVHWEAGEWTVNNRDIYTYDKEGRVGEWILQYYLNGDWQNMRRIINTYDSDGNLTVDLWQTWESSQNDWTNFNRTEYTYSGQQLTETLESIWFNDAWMPLERTTYTYSAGLLAQKYEEFSGGGVWEPSWRATYTYNGQLLQTITHEEYSGSSWQNFSQTVHESYDDQGRALLIIGKQWDGSSFVNVDKTLYQYDTPTSVDDGDLVVLPNGTSLAPNHPNPFNPNTVISFELPRQSETTLEIFDLLGRRVAEVFSGTLAAGHHEVAWSGQTTSGLPASSGVYFYRLSTDEGRLSRKMLLMK